MKKIIIAIIMLLAITSNALAVQYQPAVYKLLSTTNITAGSTTCEITVPSGYSKLKLEGQLTKKAYVNTTYIQFNSTYSGALYAFETVAFGGSTENIYANSETEYIYIIPGENVLSPYVFYLDLEIINKASEYKRLSGKYLTNSYFCGYPAGIWKNNTSSITKIEIVNDGSTFNGGSIELWGQP